MIRGTSTHSHLEDDMQDRFEQQHQAAHRVIRQNDVSPPVAIPPGHIGPVMLPGTGRQIWWTGRVAIGLRHEPERHAALSQSALWIQELMLGGAGERARAA
jgi:hypothetical protein